MNRFMEKETSTAISAFLSQTWLLIPIMAILASLAGCTPNDPYRPDEATSNTFYTTFNEPPKHLDPARAYSSDEYDLIGQVYEPPLQYHYLKRPYELTPLLATSVPEPAYYSRDGRRLSSGAPASEVAQAVYEIRIKKDVLYQPHPAFARGPDGTAVNMGLTRADLSGVESLADIKKTGTRGLVADDFIYQMMRLADPLNESPVLSILEKYILGLDEFAAGLRADLEDIRKTRKKAAGTGYNQTLDEKQDPIILDYSRHALAGVERVDGQTYRIILKTKYPQFAYWLAMPFFAPMPEEADLFYKQGPLTEKNITLDRFPVGTGPYHIETFNPNMEIVLSKNPNYRVESYPAEGEADDMGRGLLKDAGAPLPFMDRIIFKLEKEAIPRWNKFLQGYYDNSGITSDSFDQAVTVSGAGRAEVTPMMSEKGITLMTSVRPSTYYAGFNMTDDVVGGYSPERQKLRQAISIALDYEEYIEIFANGRGIPAMSALPPGIFGRVEGRGGVNPYVYTWDDGRKRPERRTIEYAKKLMKEAGYPEGRDKNGRQLVITFDNPWTGADSSAMINWYIKKFKLLGIQLENKTTDYNRFQEKMRKGNFQFFPWGWNADYPDPENFFFLLSGANAKVRFGGENASNYSNPDFDRLFKRMENMENSPGRQRVIREMTAIIQKDSPWVWGYHPVAFSLYHRWNSNVKANSMANNTMKYVKIDIAERKRLRDEWNMPVVWPMAVAAIVIIILAAPAVISARRRRETAKRG
ncbi:MAG: ABC transporter substrate-binding protein [Deltaproteobacteria bacterium]